MNQLSRNGCQALLSAVEALHGITSTKEFPARVLSIIRKILPCNSMCFNEIVLPDSMMSWIMEPAGAMPGPLLKESFLRNYTRHPGFAHFGRTGDPGSYRISDFLSRLQFHDSALYNEYYHQMDVEYQLATAFTLGPANMIAIALDRYHTDFSDSELLSLDLLRPHIIQAHRNIQTMELMKRALEGNREHLLVINRYCQLLLIDDNARRTLAGFFPISRFHTCLPDAIVNWIAAERSRFDDETDVPAPSIPLHVNSNGRTLTVRFVWGGKTSGQDMLLLKEEPLEYDAHYVDASGLTLREREILTWLSQDKTNEEIGMALSISPRTVKKHLEHIYGKLKVHRRSAAVARSFHV